MIKTKNRKISVNKRNNYLLTLPPVWWGLVFEESNDAFLSVIDDGFLLTSEPVDDNVIYKHCRLIKSGNNKQICLPKSDSLNVETTLDTDLKQIKIIYE